MQVESLFRIALTKSAIALIGRVDIREELTVLVKSKKFWNLPDSNDRWQEIRNVLWRNVDELETSFFSSPFSPGFGTDSSDVKECLRNTITPVSLELANWLEVFYKLKCIYKNIFEDLAWESNGSLHGFKTIQNMIRRKELKKTARLYLACLICDQDKIKELWMKNGKFITTFLNFKNSVDEFLMYWVDRISDTYKVEGETTSLYKITITEPCDEKILSCLNIAIDLGILEGVKYFYNTLSSAEKTERLLRKCLYDTVVALTKFDANKNELRFPDSSTVKILMFLLEQAASSKFDRILEDFCKTGTTFLNCFVKYPFRHYYSFYMKDCAKYFDNEESLRLSMRMVAVRISEDRQVYEEIYQLLWDEYIKNGYDVLSLLNDEILVKHLLRFKGYKFVNLILDCVDSEDKKEFVRNNGRNIAETLFYEKQEKVLKDFIIKCLPDKVSASYFRESELKISKLMQIYCPAFNKIEKLKMIKPYHALLDKVVASFE